MTASNADTPSAYQRFTVQITNKIADVRFNRPDKANALDQQAWHELQAVFEELDQLPEVRVIILSGEGKHFCSGIDLSMLMSVRQKTTGLGEGRARELIRQFILELQSAISAIEKCRKPVLAAIDHACVGGGVDISTACDIRYCKMISFVPRMESGDLLAICAATSWTALISSFLEV